MQKNKLPLFVEFTGGQPLLCEFRSIVCNKMIGELKDDQGIFFQLDIGRHLDATDCIPTGSHRKINDGSTIFAQQIVR